MSVRLAGGAIAVRLCATTALCGSTFIGGMAHAQSTSSGAGIQVSEVVVTANKRAQRLQDVPASIVAITGAQLEHRGELTLSDVIASTPGLSNPGNGNANWTNLTMRGVNTSGTNGLQQNTVAQLYDDITLDPIADAGTTNLRLVDIERVEVLRGPQGTLFGSGALAGAIRYITNKPNLDTFSGSAEVTAAGTETGTASYNGSATVNIPLVTDKLGLRITGYGYRDGGWITDLRTGEKLGGVDTYGIRAMLRAKPNDNLTIDLSAIYQDSADRGVGDSIYYQPPGHSGQVSDGAVNTNSDAKTLIASLSIQYDLGPVALTSISSYQRRHFDDVGVDYYYVPFVTGTPGGTDYEYAPNDADIYTQEIRLSSRGSGPLKWTVGGYYLQGDVTERYAEIAPVLTPLIGGPVIADLRVRSVQVEIAGFGDVTYTVLGKIDLSAGVRVAQSHIKDDLSIGGLFTPTGLPNVPPFFSSELREKDNPVTPHFSLTYRYTPQLSLYASAAKGFRVGGINETAGPLRPTEPQSYAPDSLWNYEVGAKGQAFGGRLGFSADLYYIDWSNLQVSINTSRGNYTGNASAARLYGFEGNFDARLTQAVGVGASVIFSKNEISKYDPAVYTDVGLEPIYKGYLLPASPERQVSAYAEYDFDVASYHAYVRGSGNYIGPQWTGFDKQGIEFGNFATADVRAGVVVDRFEVVVFANNLFNSQGIKGASQPVNLNPSTILINQYAYRIRPLTAGVTLRAHF